MPKLCPDICVTIGCNVAEIKDVTDLYPNNANGWHAIIGDPLIPVPAIRTEEVDTASIVMTYNEVDYTYALTVDDYQSPATTSMLLLTINSDDTEGLDFADGLYTFTYSLEFALEENCADTVTKLVLNTSNIQACIDSLFKAGSKEDNQTKKDYLFTQYAQLDRELYALKAGVNCRAILDADVPGILEDLTNRCNASKKECNC